MVASSAGDASRRYKVAAVVDLAAAVEDPTAAVEDLATSVLMSERERGRG